MKQLIVGALVLVTGVLLGYYGDNLTKPKENIQSLPSHVQVVEFEQLKTESARLQQENGSLRHQLMVALNQPKKTIDQTTQSVTARPMQTEVKSQADFELAALKTKIIENKIVKKLSDSPQHLSNILAQEFNSEAINYEWADAEQQKLSSWFSNNKEFAGLALQDISCRTTQCKISVAASTQEQANSIFMTLSNELKERYASSLYFTDMDLENNTTSLYISFAQDDVI